MKKFLLSVMAVASLAFAANAVTYMCVKTADGLVDKYDVEYVTEVISLESESGQVGGFSYVDLGLPSGTKWATCNVGATKPYEYGDRFAWGETEPRLRDIGIFEDYKFFDKYVRYDVYFTKYTREDRKEVLEAEDDAATVNWGEAWRMPTFEEVKELYEGCTWSDHDVYINRNINNKFRGVYGISKKNGNVIFLPFYSADSNYDHYWTSNGSEENATTMMVRSGSFQLESDRWHSIYDIRKNVHPVRAVLR